ncbi:MAG: threonine dehydratase [Alphaproteobacteria bacterium]|jgi:threonine dehydratase
MKKVTYQDILDAEMRIRSKIAISSLRHTDKLSQKLNCDLYIKYENENITGAFKERGALNKLLCLSDAEKKQGVIAASAGNHAQGVAYHAGKLNIPAIIVMPQSTPITKISTTKAYGAEVVLAGDNFDECLKTMQEIQDARNLVCIHPFDNPHIIAGQGTIGLEINRQIADLEAILIPIGGGGMISGMTIALKEHNPNLKIYGVQSKACPAFYNRYYGLENNFIPSSGLAEGIAVKQPGDIPFEIVKDRLEDILVVDEDLIEQAVSLLLTDCKTVAEGAGAAGLAGILSAPHLFAGKKTAFVLCGGNIDTRLLASVMTRTLFRQERLFTVDMTVTDRPGFLANVSKVIGDAEGNITAVRHNRYDLGRPAKDTLLTITIEARDSDHAKYIKTALLNEGFNLL